MHVEAARGTEAQQCDVLHGTTIRHQQDYAQLNVIDSFEIVLRANPVRTVEWPYRGRRNY